MPAVTSDANTPYPAIPDRIRATGTEIASGITRSLAPLRVGVALTFDGHLDEERLRRAVRLTLDAEPVLGCRLVTRGWRPSWRRLADLDEVMPVQLYQTADPGPDMAAFQADEIEDAGPQVAVAVFRDAEQDEVGIKLSRVVADGVAAKRYAYLLADVYSRLRKDPAYVPARDRAARVTAADVWGRLTDAQREDAKRARSYALPNWKVPSTSLTGEGLTYRTRALRPARFHPMIAYASAHDATVSEIMITALFRACVATFDPPAGRPLSVLCTGDLRRYLAGADELGIANLSGAGPIDLERIDGEGFPGTLTRVKELLAGLERTCYGAGAAYRTERLSRFGYRTERALVTRRFRLTDGAVLSRTYPSFTDDGVLESGRLEFDGLAPVSGHTYGSAAKGSSVVPVVSTYRDTLTVSMGFCEEDMDPAVIEGLLEAMMSEVPGAE